MVHDPPAPLPFDRRHEPRRPAQGLATVFRLDGLHFGRMHDVSLRDASAGGIAATCPAPIEPGTTVSIGFAQSGRLARRGTVVRCTPCGDGYALGVRFALGLAA